MIRAIRLIALAALLCAPAFSAEISVKVVQITDGDTVGVVDSEQRYFKVRLSSIDAPERKQAFHEKSKEALAAKIFQKDVILDAQGKDRYGRTLGVILLDGRNINRELVAEGWAWQFVRYDQSVELRTAETKAKEGRLGLWTDQSPIAPWEYRKGKR